jgi:hypothetical protein
LSRVSEFFTELDQRWPLTAQSRVQLSIIGSAALMLQFGYERGTKDSDVFETRELTSDATEALIRIAGPGTDLARRRLMHIDIVRNGIPFLPQQPGWHRTLELEKLELFSLDVVDVVVSKLKRFSGNDRSDIAEMIKRGVVPHARLIDRFQSAFDLFAGDARASELPRYAENLNTVERDLFGVRETEIDLSSLRY